jgi:hypothetical protein
MPHCVTTAARNERGRCPPAVVQRVPAGGRPNCLFIPLFGEPCDNPWVGPRPEDSPAIPGDTDAFERIDRAPEVRGRSNCPRARRVKSWINAQPRRPRPAAARAVIKPPQQEAPPARRTAPAPPRTTSSGRPAVRRGAGRTCVLLPGAEVPVRRIPRREVIRKPTPPGPVGAEVRPGVDDFGSGRRDFSCVPAQGALNRERVLLPLSRRGSRPGARAGRRRGTRHACKCRFSPKTNRFRSQRPPTFPASFCRNKRI